MALILVEAPAAEPVTRDEAKAHLRVTFAVEDDIIDKVIVAARRWVEKRCEIKLIEQTWEYRTGVFTDPVVIPSSPVQSVELVSYINEDGDVVELDAADFYAIENEVFATDAWPTDVFVRKDAVRTRFVAGVPAADLDEDLRQAVLMMVGHYYENRSDVLLTPVRQELQVTPAGVEALIAPYVAMRL